MVIPLRVEDSKCFLDLSILQRVEGDDGDSTARGEQAPDAIEQVLQRFQFIVDGDAKCLEGAGCGIHFLVLVAGNRSTDHRGELPGGDDRLQRPSMNDRCGDPPGVAILTQFTDQSLQFLFGDPVQELRCCLAAGGVHPHIERSIETKRETSICFVELRGRDSQIRQHQIPGAISDVCSQGWQVSEVPVDQFDTICR